MSSPSLAEQKENMRAAMQERLHALSTKNLEAESRSIVRRIDELLAKNQSVCAFFPLRTEPDIRPFIEELLAQGRHVYLPCFDGTTILFRRIQALSELVRSPFGFPEPPPTAPVLDPQEAVIVLVPGRAFDPAGGRLGRGNGGYDRWIADRRKAGAGARYYGIALACQLVQEVPMGPEDQRLDGIITARGFQQRKELV
ncbi:MAG: 5-formyltetrahydrofolate cyclo-ligase [Candidatus Peribacteraceae bacterium]|nr:5-formyltetrahydrofolate cyclo-ligase [Candidatus Peribacteraceae bacterium]